jgi:outer membrane protein assembly factor BamB
LRGKREEGQQDSLMGYRYRQEIRALALATVTLLAIFLAACNRRHGTNGRRSSETAVASNPLRKIDPQPAERPLDPPPPASNPQVLTYHNDNQRTGANLQERILTPANVNAATFGKIAMLNVQGKVDAEPLYVSSLQIKGRKRNAVFIVTEHDLAYAFDADTLAQLWRVSLIPAGEKPSDKRDCEQIEPEIGITATPVIELQAGPHGTMYVVAMSKDARGKYFQRLHALDLTTGADRLPPSTITATYTATDASGHRTTVAFDPKQYKERTALLLWNGVIYTTWSSHCDHDPYNGWVIALSATTLKRVSALCLTPNGTEGSLWMTGNGPAVGPSGDIYLLDGNGTFDPTLDSHGFPAERDFGNAFLRLEAHGNYLGVRDYFVMHNTAAESNGDEDLGSGGLIVLPDVKDANGTVRHLAIGAGKDQAIYVVNRDAMGKFNPANDSAIYEELPNALGGAEFGSPAYFNGVVYYGAYLAPMKAFPIVKARLAALPSSQTRDRFDYPGVIPSVSASGYSNGIVWVVEAVHSDKGVLHAYDASNLARELYNSNQAPNGRDHFLSNKFITPMIAQGKVFVGTRAGVAVFGLLQSKK